MSSKKGSGGGAVSSFQYNCDCGENFVQIAEAVDHVNRFKDHQLTRTSR